MTTKTEKPLITPLQTLLPHLLTIGLPFPFALLVSKCCEDVRLIPCQQNVNRGLREYLELREQEQCVLPRLDGGTHDRRIPLHGTEEEQAKGQ